jgi:hypothetical protein
MQMDPYLHINPLQTACRSDMMSYPSSSTWGEDECVHIKYVTKSLGGVNKPVQKRSKANSTSSSSANSNKPDDVLAITKSDTASIEDDEEDYMKKPRLHDDSASSFSPFVSGMMTSDAQIGASMMLDELSSSWHIKSVDQTILPPSMTVKSTSSSSWSSSPVENSSPRGIFLSIPGAAVGAGSADGAAELTAPTHSTYTAHVGMEATVPAGSGGGMPEGSNLDGECATASAPNMMGLNPVNQMDISKQTAIYYGKHYLHCVFID